ncbi:hypothetical protein SAMN05216351_10747 [Pseudobutyrivibrio sp. JW11]|uniref:hypothetical protein n=1 Tax=Pseudobutyrivibrio sp. JW11 TaxID=1855302 RepID=UPI0008ED43B0|nr:hypothetical protein [Pseudobutyrivibrio sp. JW11]SFO35361.1 hypothetical protein SAMN05216351_10747 [Pseudobutyrivibrio sp. JW11]
MNKGSILKKYLPWVWLVAGYIHDVVFILTSGRYMLDSDMASEMILSDLLNKEHSIITHSWIYSTEIRVAETQWFFRIGLLLSPDNWIVARAIGTAIMLALYIAVWLLLCKVLGWEKIGVWICAMLLWPFGFWYFMDITWGAYYVPHSIFMIVSLVILIVLAKKSADGNSIYNIKNALLCMLLLAIAFISGLNGIRNTLIFYAPLTVYAIVVLYFYLRENGLKNALIDKTVKLVFARGSIIATAFNFAGYVGNHVFFENKYQYSSYNSMTWGSGTNSVTKTFKWFIDSFGYTDNATKELFSVNGICTGVGLLICFVLVISVIRLAMNFKNMSEMDQLYAGIFFAMLVTIGLVFTYIYGEEQYWLTTVQFGVAAIFLEIKTDDKLKDFERKAAPTVLLIMAVLSSVGIVKANIETPMRANPGIEEVISFLEEEGYTQGCATFWHGPIITELTNGDIEMWTVTDEHDGMARWLQKSSHNTVPTGRYFVLYVDDEVSYLDEFEEYSGDKGELVYDDGTYTIFEYNN